MWQTIKRRIFAGLIALMPIMATYWIIRLLFDFLDRFSGPLLKTIGIEIPNDDRETVSLKDIISSKEYENSKASLTMALGKDIQGKPCLLYTSPSPQD